MDIKEIKVLLEECNKLKLISVNKMEYKQCFPFALVRAKTHTASSSTIQQQSRPTCRPTLNSLDSQ